MKNINKETLRLFNAIQVHDKSIKYEMDEDLMKHTIKNGYILDPSVPTKKTILNDIESVVGISGEKANASFHKSWSVIKDTLQESLWLQAIIHYITTYGFEGLGIYNEDTVYIPNEKLEFPDIKHDIPLVVIKAMTPKDILDKIIQLGNSGIALMQETLDDIMAIVEKNKYDSEFIKEIQNRELKSLLVDFYGIIPEEPIEFLRYLITKLTNESLIIKNDELISKIKEANGKYLDDLIQKAPDNLASIFFRYKPLFLAMKSISRNKNFFNRLRKKANKLHKPLGEDYLNNITAQIKHNSFNPDKLKEKLKSATIFRKIRLAYALNFRKKDCDSIVYRIRNGRGWATEFEWSEELLSDVENALEIVISSIVDDIKKNVKDKTIYIPSNVHYSLPATEKQFTGVFPTGSYISVPEDMIVGIHWFNTDKRVDLDLSLIGESGKLGWDSYYKSDSENILFSGDMTDAPKPNGASELFYIGGCFEEPEIMMVNYYNFVRGDEVKTKILIASEKPKTAFEENYMIDTNNIIGNTIINIKKKQNILGIITNVDDENRFYFSNVSIGNSITSCGDEYNTHTRKFLINSMINSLDFGNILSMAGANIINEEPDEEKYIDLSPTVLDKTTIIDLIKE